MKALTATRTYSCRIVLLAALAAGGLAHAGLQIPYTPDANTLHLWHLDEPSNQYFYQPDLGELESRRAQLKRVP